MTLLTRPIPATLLALVALLAALIVSAHPGPAAAQAPAGVIPGQYIVVFDADVDDPAALATRLVAAHRGAVIFTYEHALKGFAARLSSAAAEALARNPHVARVEPDGVVQADGSGTQPNPPSWGLDRIDQRDLPLDNTYAYATSGVGVSVYIIDTGIRISHTEFGGRAAYGWDFVGKDAVASDCNGHGTHVAGSVGGANYGVAKDAALIAVRVLDCRGRGSWSGVIAGIDYVTAEATDGDGFADLPAVANMSLGGGFNSAVNAAITNSIAAGVSYAVSAGNSDGDACARSPASTPDALTVGATTSSDREASFSSFGTCVDLLAPGVSITSAWKGSDSDTRTISGTSMSAPHVAGAAARYLETTPSASAAQVASGITGTATAGQISLKSESASAGTPNLLLYLGSGPPNDPPTANFTYVTYVGEPMVDFADTSDDDPDGWIVGWSWDFGDGGSSSLPNPSHPYSTNATYTVTLTVTDNGGASDAVSHAVAVSGANEPPLADDQAVTLPEDTTVAITLTASDAENDPLSFRVVGGPSTGSLSGTAPNLTYTPDGDFHGADSFSFVTNDGTADSSPATVIITVSPVNDAPLAEDQSVTTAESTPVAVTLIGSDMDGDPLSFAVADPSHGSLAGTAPDLTYTPMAGYTGGDSFSFVTNDGTADSNPATVSITVTAAATMSVHVADLDGSRAAKGRSGKWSATVVVAVHDGGEGAASGATVSGIWSGGYSGSDSCVTDSGGTCRVKSGAIKGSPNATFTVTGVSRSGFSYEAVANHDPDTDSTGTTITVDKPGT